MRNLSEKVSLSLKTRLENDLQKRGEVRIRRVRINIAARQGK